MSSEFRISTNVVEELKIWRRFPVKSQFRNLTSKKCPYCGSNLTVIVSTIERMDDDTLWVSHEEVCDNCKEYDKIYTTRFWPYEELVRVWLG